MSNLVGVGRLELPTSCTPCMRATNCAIPRQIVNQTTASILKKRNNTRRIAANSHCLGGRCTFPQASHASAKALFVLVQATGLVRLYQ